MSQLEHDGTPSEEMIQGWNEANDYVHEGEDIEVDGDMDFVSDVPDEFPGGF